MIPGAKLKSINTVLSIALASVIANSIGVATAQSSSAEQDLKRVRQQVTDQLDLLTSRIKLLGSIGSTNRVCDARVFLKAIEWALKYDALAPADIPPIRRTLERATHRIEDLEARRISWQLLKGRLARGYVSKVDGSVQPYGLVIPASYDPSKPTRLDVVLHGSSHPTGMSEVHFLSGFEEHASGGPKDVNYIELHPLGRVENCYRWAGETDVFEAIEDVCGCYNIDRERIVLRGMSMGASGTWHLGLKHPDRFAALGPYCGYVDTHRFSETPGMNFVKVGPLPEVQEMGLHMLDSVDYAANAGVVPAIGAIGDKDPFFQAHVIMGDAMKREGLDMVNIISPGTGHVQDPVTWAEQMRRIAVYADKGLDPAPRHIRFVTWTLKYSQCFWIQLVKLQHHYERAEIVADMNPDGSMVIQQTRNITQFKVSLHSFKQPIKSITIGGVEVHLPKSDAKLTSEYIDLELHGSRWSILPHGMVPPRVTGKQPDQQGPIDDAFSTPFLCVRGTGKPWNPAVQAWSEANLRRFAYEWSRYFRGELPIKDDAKVTGDDCKRCNLILFGDPGSNIWIRKALPSLPIRWTKNSLRCGSLETEKGNDLAPVLICPSPFDGSQAGGANPRPARYVVINSGHTFHEPELSTLNYLLFPRLGDWAVLRVGASQPTDSSAPLNETVLGSGYFNEDWK